MHKKFCFANCFLDKSSKLYKFLTSEILIFLSSIGFILIMMIVLFIGIIFLDLKEIFILFLDVFLFSFFYQKLNLLSFRDNIRSLFKINVLSFFNALFLVILFLVINIILPSSQFTFIDKDLVITMKNYSANFYSDCFIIDFLVIKTSLSAIKQWLFVKEFLMGNETVRVFLIIIFLSGNFYFFYLFSKFILTFKEIIDGFKITK